jgi:hypothetical protein
MAIFRPSLKFKRIRQRFGIRAPKLAIKTHVAWYWRALAAIVALPIALALSLWIYETGKNLAGFGNSEPSRDIQALRNYVMEIDAELTKLRSIAGSGESSLQIERATQKQLSLQVKSLELENAALKQDLAFFEGLVPASELGDETGVKINNLRVDQGISSDEYRYRMLVVNQGGRQVKAFKGELQLLVKVQQGGKNAIITLPSVAEPTPQNFNLEIKHFHRLEGVFTIPAGAVIKSVEARLLKDGAVRAKQTATL